MNLSSVTIIIHFKFPLLKLIKLKVKETSAAKSKERRNFYLGLGNSRLGKQSSKSFLISYINYD